MKAKFVAGWLVAACGLGVVFAAMGAEGPSPMLAAIRADTAAAREISFRELADALTDLEVQAFAPRPGESVTQRSGDAARIKPDKNGEIELGTIPGPGCLYRFFLAFPKVPEKGTLAFYFDDAPKPELTLPTPEALWAETPPFQPPWTISRKPRPAADFCFPLPFAKNFRVVYRPENETAPRPMFIFQAKLFPSGTTLASFRAAATPSYLETLDSARQDAARKREKAVVVTETVTLRPGDRRTALALTGAGLVRELQIRLSDVSDDALRLVSLRVLADEAEDDLYRVSPAIDSPVGDFFCLPLGLPATLDAAPIAWSEATGGIFRYVMPYSNGLRIELANGSGKAISVTVAAAMERKDRLDARYGRLCARWVRLRSGEKRSVVLFQRLSGQGRFLGYSLSLTALGPAPCKILGQSLLVDRFQGLLGLWDWSGTTLNRPDGDGVGLYALSSALSIPFFDSLALNVTTEGPTDLSGATFFYLNNALLPRPAALPPIKRTRYRVKGFAGPELLEAEGLRVIVADGAATAFSTKKYPGQEWSGEQVLRFIPRDKTGKLVLEAPKPKAKAPNNRYTVWAAFVKGPACGQFRLDAPGAENIDCYAPTIGPSGLVPLGEIAADSGGDTVRVGFDVQWKSDASFDHRIEIDALRIGPSGEEIK